MPERAHPGTISDPVHGFVGFTTLERVIIDERITQRLRNISQTGLGSYVFPELQSKRLAHSFGAMHLATRFLSSTLRNSEPDIVAQLVQGIRDLARVAFGPGNTNFGQTVPIPRLFELNRGILQAHMYAPDDAAEISVVEQALRLAALFHDLGHLPFSHDFEYALDDLHRHLSPDDRLSPLINEIYDSLGETEVKIHEKIGPELGHIVLRHRIQQNAAATDLDLRIFDIAFDIWNSTEPSDEFSPPPDSRKATLQWLKSMLSGELDVDRCDYLLRDGRNYGFEFAQFNLDRLTDNLLTSKTQNGTFVLSVRSQGLSALESFVLSRYRSYQLGVLHHKTSQVSAALKYSIKKTIVLGFSDSTSPILGFIDDLKTVANYGFSRNKARSENSTSPEIPVGILDRFSRYDDAWWIETMRNHFDKHGNDSWTDLVLWRTPGPTSLWKRQDELIKILEVFSEESSQFSELIEGTDGGGAALRIWNSLLPERSNREGQKKWAELEGRLQAEQGILLVRKTFPPYKVNRTTGHCSGLYIQTKGTSEPTPLDVMSPLVRSLRDSLDESVQVQAFSSTTLDRNERREQGLAVVKQLWGIMAP